MGGSRDRSRASFLHSAEMLMLLQIHIMSFWPDFPVQLMDMDSLLLVTVLETIQTIRGTAMSTVEGHEKGEYRQ